MKGKPKLFMLGLSFEGQELTGYIGLRNWVGSGRMISSCVH